MESCCCNLCGNEHSTRKQTRPTRAFLILEVITLRDELAEARQRIRALEDAYRMYNLAQ